MANTLAYHDTETITAVKCFTVHAPGASGWICTLGHRVVSQMLCHCASETQPVLIQNGI
jgi:hypothetical protein